MKSFLTTTPLPSLNVILKTKFLCKFSVFIQLITNPDMLHVSILPHHRQFSRILSNLRYCIKLCNSSLLFIVHSIVPHSIYFIILYLFMPFSLFKYVGIAVSTVHAIYADFLHIKLSVLCTFTSRLY